MYHFAKPWYAKEIQMNANSLAVVPVGHSAHMGWCPGTRKPRKHTAIEGHPETLLLWNNTALRGSLFITSITSLRAGPPEWS